MSKEIKESPHLSFMMPCGSTITTIDLNSLCEYYKLNKTKMIEVVDKKIDSYQGWKLYNRHSEPNSFQNRKLQVLIILKNILNLKNKKHQEIISEIEKL
ncbi:MAG: hypothetical protein Q7R95_02365 [bacterium]|nr:hypothetical protein [bacterium]